MIVIHTTPVFKYKNSIMHLCDGSFSFNDKISSCFKALIRNSSSAEQKPEHVFPDCTNNHLWNNNFSVALLVRSDNRFFSRLVKKLYEACLSSTELAYDIMLFINATYSYIMNTFSAEDIVRTIPDFSDENAHDWIKFGHYKKIVNINDTPYEFQLQRIYSKSLHKTHAVFPLGIIPFMRENLFDILLYLHQIFHGDSSLEDFHGRLRALLEYLYATPKINKMSDNLLSNLICSFIADHFKDFYQNSFMTVTKGLTKDCVKNSFLRDDVACPLPTWEKCESALTVLNFFVKKRETAKKQEKYQGGGIKHVKYHKEGGY